MLGVGTGSHRLRAATFSIYSKKADMYHPAKFFGIAFALFGVFTSTWGVTSSPGMMPLASKKLLHRQQILDFIGHKLPGFLHS